MKKLIILLLAAALPVCADYVELKSGEKYIGDVVTNDDEIVVVETMDGIVTVARKMVKDVTEAVSVVGEYKRQKAAAKTAVDHFKIYKWCYANDYAIAGDLELEQALKMDPDVEQKALKEEANQAPKTSAEKKEAERKRVQRILKIRRALSSVRNLAGTKRAEKHIDQLKGFDPAEKAPVLVQQLNYTGAKYEAYRAFLIKELSGIPGIKDEVFTKHLLKEPNEELRRETYKIITRDPAHLKEAEKVMIKTLGRDTAKMRARCNAAQALGWMESRGGVAVLVRRVKMMWGPSARAHLFTSTQHTYVRDVTPVVAAGATSFDPEIDTYTTGMVLDVKIHSIERDMVIASLQQITNTIMPSDKDWLDWWDEKGKEEYGE